MTSRTWGILVGLGLAACGSPADPGSPDAEVEAIDGGVDACVPVAPFEPASTPVDLYLMLDQTGSMADPVTTGTKWTQVTSAITAFATGVEGSPAIGLQYFGLPGGSTDSCTASDYATPEVELAAAPAVANALTTSLGGHAPGSTATLSAAVQGAVDHADAWHATHLDHEIAAVLITDGLATDCDTNVSNIAAIAAAASARTFVIAIGTGLGALDPIAAAGRTGAARVVDTTGNVASQATDALIAIHAEVGCSFAPFGNADVVEFSLQYTPPSGTPAAVPHVANLAACSGPGWYYEGGTGPSLFSLCPATCTTVTGDAGAGSLEVVPSC